MLIGKQVSIPQPFTERQKNDQLQIPEVTASYPLSLHHCSSPTQWSADHKTSPTPNIIWASSAASQVSRSSSPLTAAPSISR